jgi:glycosyltransferase involved in cell wall biosynthesis
MKILQYYPVALSGDFGSSISVRGWCSALANAGADVTLAVDAEAVRMKPPDGICCIPFPHAGRGRLRVPRGLTRLASNHDLVVVHGGWTPIPVIAGRSAARASVPYITTPHGAYHPLVVRRRPVLKQSWLQLVERAHLRNAFATHIFFAQEQHHLATLNAVPPTIVAPNGITVPGNLRWDGGSGGYLAWLGRFDPINKGLDLILEALARLSPKDRPTIHLRGPDLRGGRVRVADHAARLGLERWIVLDGPIYGEAKWSFLSRAIGFVFPSRFDACPTAVGEAAALGLPCLVTSFPLGNLLAQNGGAVMCAQTAESVRCGLATLLTPEAAAIGQQAAKTASECLGWEAVAGSWLKQVEALPRSGLNVTQPATSIDQPLA